MVRTPLARRIESDDLLNSVACYLPQFNPESTQDVVDYLMGRKDDMGESSIGKQSIVLNPVTITAAVPKSEADYQQELKAYEENEKAIETARQAQPGYQASLAGIAIQEPLDMQERSPRLPRRSGPSTSRRQKRSWRLSPQRATTLQRLPRSNLRHLSQVPHGPSRPSPSRS